MRLYHRALSRIKRFFNRNPDRLFRSVKGVIHIGANTGQERQYYESFGLKVLWVEPIPEVFAELRCNISGFPRQTALQALITDRDGEYYKFNVADNGGQSSSILDFKEHKDVWPGVSFNGTIELISTTLTTLMEKAGLNRLEYGGLVMDTQGSELLVLKGAEQILRDFLFVKAEVADFESYTGCCQLKELQDFMNAHGFREYTRFAFASSKTGGQYYDITFKRV